MLEACYLKLFENSSPHGVSLRESSLSCDVLQIKRSGFEPRPGHCVVFLGKTLYPHSASLHPGV